MRVRVVRAGAGATAVLKVGGKTIQVKASFPLRVGESYLVRAERGKAGVVLRLEGQVPRAVPAAEVAARLGLPENDTALAVVRAFVRSGVALVPQRLGRAYRRVVASGGESAKERERARLAALVEKKGLGHSDEVFDAVTACLGSGEGPGGYGSRSHQGSSGGDVPPEIAELEESVRTSFALGEEADHPLHLFNHVVGDGDHWVVIPVKAPGLDASLRIRLTRTAALGSPDGAGVREAVLVAERGGHRWVFGINPSADGWTVDRHDADVGSGHDGFSRDEGGDIMTSVDNNA